VSMCIWSFWVHATPHCGTAKRWIGIGLIAAVIGWAGYYATHKQYRREHPVLVKASEPRAQPMQTNFTPSIADISAKMAQMDKVFIRESIVQIEDTLRDKTDHERQLIVKDKYFG